MNGDICLDSATTHTILKDRKYFSHLVSWEIDVNTISGTTKIIEGFGRANKSLYGGLGEILRKFSITIFKSTQNLWFDAKLQKLSTRSLIKMLKSI